MEKIRKVKIILAFAVIFCFISQIDSEVSAIEWTQLLGTSYDEAGRSIAVDSNDNIYITGWAQGDLDGKTNEGSYDIFIAKYDTNGNKLWTQLLGTPTRDYGWGIAVDLNDSIYIAGSTDGDLDGNTNAGSFDIFIAKYDTNGNKLWTQLLGTSGYEEGESVAVDSNGNIYITGSTDGDLDGNTNAGMKDIFIAKYDTNGNKLWTQLLGSPTDDYGKGISLDLNGNICITGDAKGDLDGNTNAGIEDIFIAKYDTNGNKLWTQLLGSPAEEIGFSIAVDSSDNIYITGTTEGDLDGNTNAGYYDIFIAKYDTNGNKLWTQLLGTSYDEAGRSIVVDSSDNIYITGSTDGDLDGNTNAGSDEILIAKYDTNGNKLWTQLLGTSVQDDGQGIAMDSNDNIYITGGTEGDLDGNTNAGSEDIFTVALLRPSITLTSPNGGEELSVGETFEIIWTSAGEPTVKIEYSINRGNDWITIVESTGNDGSYEWEIPLGPSDECLVRISYAVDGASDVSDAIFSISVPLYPIAEIIGIWDNGIRYWDVAVSQWTQMHPNPPDGDIAAGDFTGDGKADVASLWDGGLWYQDGATLAWTKVSGAGAVSLTAGDVTGDSRSEIISTWSSGIWYWDVSASKWTQMTSSTPTGDIAAGDFTGDGKADVASCWGSGLWYQDWASLSWIKVSGSAPNSLTAGDVTGDGRDEIIGTWSSGIWYWDVSASKWTQMTSSTPIGDLAAGDYTGDGKADVASCWGNGLWYQDGDTLDWTKVSSAAPVSLTVGDVTGN